MEIEFRDRPIPLNETVRMSSWNMQRGGKEGKLAHVRKLLEKDDSAFVVIQEINAFSFERLLDDAFVRDKYIFTFCEAHVDVAGLGQAMFVRKVYGGKVWNQYALKGLANGRGVPMWVSTDGQRCVVGIHCLSGNDRDGNRVIHFQSLRKHLLTLAYAHIICGDLNMNDDVDQYRYIEGHRHLKAGILDGCLTACRPGATLPYIELEQGRGGGALYSSDHPICEYLVVWLHI